jgi:chloramphenicol 3-O phosphotransferase
MVPGSNGRLPCPGESRLRPLVTRPGDVVVLNGAPRSGKSSIAASIQDSFAGLWLNVGVDAFSGVTPARSRPGIGLRPGGERPDLEDDVVRLYRGLFGSVACLSRLGLDVVVDAGLHDHYSRPLGILELVAAELEHTPAYLVGVRCPLEVIMARRDEEVREGRPVRYVTTSPEGSIPEPVLRWQEAVHTPGIYDVEVDTSVASPAACAARIRRRVEQGAPTAFGRLLSEL